ncbi:hypothetical protein FC650_13380 [Vibrio natriegens]|uniref:hypothetical protein n=1 Tax=Vibrio natriegens TaxID=691 RepID=UPI001593DBC8|nr:hypothetical protein [Vibrio natriegens]NVC94613.1 hypothetical protein [Vibrio natriegens]
MSAQKVLDLFEKQIIKSTSDNDVCFELASTETKDAFSQAINDAGYKETIRHYDGKCQVKTGAIYWNSGKFLFTSDESLFEECETQNKVPEGLLYFDKENNRFVEFNSNLDLHKQLEIFIKLRALLTEIADYSIHNEEVIFLIKNDDGGVKHKVSLSLDYESFVQAFTDKEIDLSESVKLLNKLRQAISLDDAQDKERRNCMRSAFDVIIQGLNNESEIFSYTLANIVKFDATYTAHHNMFLSEFTINKVIQEINTKDLEYTGKINDITSSVQTKALAIPGAMVAIAAVMKVESYSSAFGVVIALFLTCLTIQKSLDIYKDSFTHLSKQVTNVFSRYQVLSHKSQVRTEAKTTEEALGNLIEKGENGLSFVSKIIWGVWFASLILVCIKLGEAHFNTKETKAENPSVLTSPKTQVNVISAKGSEMTDDAEPPKLQPHKSNMQVSEKEQQALTKPESASSK